MNLPEAEPLAPEVSLSAKNAATKRCVYSKCQREFTPPKKGKKARYCSDEHRRLYQNERRRTATVSRRNAHYRRYHFDQTAVFDGRVSGAVRQWVGPYRSTKRERQERMIYEQSLTEVAR